MLLIWLGKSVKIQVCFFSEVSQLQSREQSFPLMYGLKVRLQLHRVSVVASFSPACFLIAF